MWIYGTQRNGDLRPQRNGTKEIVLSIRGVRHSNARLVALRADMTGMDKLSDKHLLTVPRAQPPLCSATRSRESRSYPVRLLLLEKKHQKSEPVVPLRKLVLNEKTAVYEKDKLVKKPKALTQIKSGLPLVQQQGTFCWPQKLLPHLKGSLPKRYPAAVTCIPSLSCPVPSGAWSTERCHRASSPIPLCAAKASSRRDLLASTQPAVRAGWPTGQWLCHSPGIPVLTSN